MMKKYSFLLLLVFSFQISKSQSVTCPPNIDFETGGYSNWQFFTGSCCPIGGLFNSGQINGRHTITSGTGLDPYGNFPIVAPGGGNFSMQLGNDNTGGEAERIRYYVQVPMGTSNFSLVYRYAVVFEDPSHAPVDQPRFEISVFDSATNALLPCLQYSYIASSSVPGFLNSPIDPDIKYKSWTTASIDLSGLGGTTVAVDFSTGDCGLGGHFGYGYVDVSCGLFQISGAICDNATSFTLNAPAGFQTYGWFNSNYSISYGTGLSITLPSPLTTTTYNLILTPFPGYGCPDTLTTIAIAGFTTYDTIDVSICPGDNYQGFSVPGSYNFDTLINSTGCDSIIQLNLSYTSASVTDSINASICQGGSYFGYTAAGTYLDTFSNVAGCDSLYRKIVLTVLPITTSTQTVSICQGQSYLGYVNSGTYTDTFANVNLCDSIRTLNLTVINPNAFYVITPVKSNFCVGELVTVQDLNSQPNGIGNTFEWQWGDGTITTGNLSTHAYTDSGTYTIKMIFTTPLGCKDSMSQTINIVAPTEVSFTANESEVCLGDPISFTDSMKFATTFQWNFDDNTTLNNVHFPSHVFELAGNYNVTLTGFNQTCGDVTYSLPITILDYPYVQLGKDSSFCPGITKGILLAPVYLNNIDNYLWSTGESTSSIIALNAGYYWVKASNKQCSSVDSIWIKRDCYINIPNAFSPNADGSNDYFFPREILSSGLTSFKMSVFNRWGEEIFTTASLNGRGWDGQYGGKKQPQGVYVYTMDVVFNNGIRKNYKGNVTLMR